MAAGKEWTKYPPRPQYRAFSGKVILRGSGFFCLLKSTRDNQEHRTRTDPCHMPGIISEEQIQDRRTKVAVVERTDLE